MECGFGHENFQKILDSIASFLSRVYEISLIMMKKGGQRIKSI